MRTGTTEQPPWRVAVTRDEGEAGALGEALRHRGFVPVACPVLSEAAPTNASVLVTAARGLGEYAWVICASVRAVEALSRALPGSWPAGVRTAAVGLATARALEAVGVTPAPVVAAVAGAEPLWEALSALDTWRGRRVLVLTTPGGRTALIEGLQAAGADVDAVEAYRMVPRPADDIRRDWIAAAADALVLASAATATRLLDAVGEEAVKRLRAVVALGATTAEVLAARGVPYQRSTEASFDAAAEAVLRACQGVRS